MPRDLTRSLQRSLTHLLPPPVKGGSFGAPIPTHFRPTQKFVQVKDRLAFWHIAPGDTVKLVRGPAELKGAIGTVARVERESSRVFLVENQFSAKKRQQNQYPGEAFRPEHSAEAVVFIPKAFHVDNFRLQLREGTTTHTALRMKRGPVSWDRNYRRFTWKRFGLFKDLIGTQERGDGKEDDGWRQIAWPKEAVPERSGAGLNDTIAELSIKQSFRPSLADLSLHANRGPNTVKAPVTELSLPALDFSGGHYSRAVRTKRYNKNKLETKVFTKSERRHERADAANKKVSKTQARSPVELA